MIQNAITLSKEEWKDAIERLGEATTMFANALQRANFEGKGDQDAREWIADMTCALAAMHYVAEFAADKCVFAAGIADKE